MSARTTAAAATPHVELRGPAAPRVTPLAEPLTDEEIRACEERRWY